MANQRTLAVKVNINEMVGNEKPNKEGDQNNFRRFTIFSLKENHSPSKRAVEL